MSVSLHQNVSSMAKYRLKNTEIERSIGPLGDKTCDEVETLLDLQIIDKKKQTDLLRFKTTERKRYLTDLAIKFRNFLNQQEKKHLEKKVERPLKKNTCDLQNQIHSIEVKIREANYVQKKYIDVHKSLKEDENKFESKIQKLEKEFDTQKRDIQNLQQILDEATRMRNRARHDLFQEERAANATAIQEERESTEGRRLVNERKIELERLERKIFQTGKISARPEPEGIEDNAEDTPSTCHVVESMTQQFEVLKKATGSITPDEVLRRFESQKDTEQRLLLLRRKFEEVKKQLELKLEDLLAKVEELKFAEFKNSDKTICTTEHIMSEIDSNIERGRLCREKRIKHEEMLKTILEYLENLSFGLNPQALREKNAPSAISVLENQIQIFLNKGGRSTNLKSTEGETFLPGSTEDKWLPGPYSGLAGKPTLPQTRSSPLPPPPPGSEEDEEVPSRSYLKRQAQLVIDAKARKKKIRIQLQKRN